MKNTHSISDEKKIERPAQFEVCVGFARVSVKGDTPEEIIQNARRQFCLEMPRMWDLFTNMPDQRFQIQARKSA